MTPGAVGGPGGAADQDDGADAIDERRHDQRHHVETAVLEPDGVDRRHLPRIEQPRLQSRADDAGQTNRRQHDQHPERDAAPAREEQKNTA